MDWWILAFSVVGAVGGVAGALLTWWRQEMSAATIDIRRTDERAIVRFAAVGSRPLHGPQIEVIYGGRSYGTEMPPVLSGSDAPVEMTIPSHGRPQHTELTASIQWTEFGSKSPQLRGLKFGSGGQTWEWKRRKGWVPFSERQMRKLQGRYSQL